MERFRARAKEQIRMGEDLARSLGADRNHCVDACHFLIPDGRAARQGDNPNGLAINEPKLAHLIPQALEIERAAVRDMLGSDFARLVQKLRRYGSSRSGDIARLKAHREGNWNVQR